MSSSHQQPPQPLAQIRPSAAVDVDVDESSDDISCSVLSEELLSMLSPEARSALEAHRNAERDAKIKLSKAQADGTTEIGEDFGMSQFWYTDECADEMAKVLVMEARLQKKKIIKFKSHTYSMYFSSICI